jgi:membrane protein YqaA with SNARE-associated domain
MLSRVASAQIYRGRHQIRNRIVSNSEKWLNSPRDSVGAETVGTRGIMLQVQDIVTWMRYLCMQYGYFGIFVISLVGALSIIVPVPDTIVVFTLAGLKIGDGWVFEPLLIALAAAIGAVIGEFSGYLLGFGSRKAITGRYKKNVDFLVKVFNKFGAIAIFVFALTPLPDDLVFIPLGVIRYNPLKALAPALIGKFLMSLIVAYSGRFSIGIIRDVFGLGSDLVSVLISTVIGIVMAIAMFKMDWSKYFEKYLIK